MLTNKKAVLFDLDGTLVDSMWVWVKIDEIYGEQYGITYPDTFHDDIEGMSFTETAHYFKNRLQMKKSVEEIMDDWNEMALETYRTIVPFKTGAKEFLQYLFDNGIKTAICTSNSRMLVEAAASSLTELQNIDCIVTSCDVNAGKPAPDVYLKAAEKLGVLPEECLVFEDIPQGIMAGHNAGMKVCAVEDAFSAYLAEEKKRLADYYIQDYFEIIQK